MCLFVQKNYIPLIFLRGYKAARLRVNMLDGDIKIDIKNVVPSTKWIENNLLNVYSYYHHFQSRYLLKND